MRIPSILLALLVTSAAYAQTAPAESVAASETDSTVTLTLDRCIEIALSESPTIRVADMEVRRLDYSRRDVIGQLLPTIDFGASYNRTLAKQTMYMDMDFGGFGGGDNDSDESQSAESRAGSSGGGGIKVGQDNSWSLGFSGSLPLIAPQLWKSIGLSDAQILVSMEQARQSRQNLVNQVKNAYYGLLLAVESKRTIQESYDMAELTYRMYVDRHAAGAASDYDVLRTSVAMRNIEPELLSADVAVKQARLRLLLLMGLESTFTFEPATALRDYQEDMYATALNLTRDYSQNADLKLLDLNTDVLRRSLSIQKLSFAPTLALTANYNWTSMNNGSPFKNFRWSPYSMVGVSLSVPLFRGGSRVWKVKEAEVQVDEMTWQRQNLERSIAMQVDLAIDNIGVNVRQIASCSESVGQAERAHNIMEQSFAIGAASYLDLRDSELSLTRARLTYYQAIYNFLVANSDLELLLGTAEID